MWHEARRQEKKIRGIMVDYKRRADRRREFYEKIKQDPAQFLRMYGRPVKIHLDQAVALAAEGPQSMMPWQGDINNMIDRFDVRANLDLIPEYVPERHKRSSSYDEDERLANYERYRTLVENEAAGLSEEQCLHQIYLDEHFGTIQKDNPEEKKKNVDKKAAIGFVYEGSTPVDKELDNEESEEEESEEDIETADLDVTIDVDMLTPDQIKDVNMCASQYGMKDDDFVRLLRKDKEELEVLRAAKQLEEAKAQFSGRKSRRERRAINEKRQNPQRFSRPSYAARESPKYEPYKRLGSSSRSRSRSRSSDVAPVTFITSFGADSDDEGVLQGPSFPSNAKRAVKKRTTQPETSKCETPWLARQRSTRRKSRSRSLSRSRSRSPDGMKRHSSSKSSLSSGRSYSQSRSRSWSRSENRQSSSRQGNNGRSGSTRSKREQRSHSSSSSGSRSRSRSRSRSSRRRSVKRSESPVKKPVIKRYRRESLSSGSELSGLESEEDNMKTNSSATSPMQKTLLKNEPSKIPESSKSGKISSKPQQFQASSSVPKKTPQEILKRRMQAQLSRQFKADKKAEITKITKQEQERLDREEEIRTLALEMRRREREKRHREREEEERERKARRKNRHSDKGSDSGSSDENNSNSNASESDSPDRIISPLSSPGKSKEAGDKGKLERKNSDKQVDSRKDDRRRGPTQTMPLSQLTDERRKSDDRKWEGRRENSRWDGDGEREKPRVSRRGRWDGPPGQHPSDQRWEEGSRNWGSYPSRWEGAPGEWGDGRRRTRPPSAAYRSRVPRPLLSRSRSPLMSRPRPPSDPSLIQDHIDFD